MPLACAIGDADIVHCSLPNRAIGFPKVLIGGRPWSVMGDLNTPHLQPGTPCTVHVAAIGAGSPTVLLQGRPAGAISSPIVGCTAVATGFSKVFVGF